ncbi:MAG: AMP-binding protein [Actinobacteria bacterium]|nr:AMP-binding protein [Actinomycetota bacterium]
MATMGEMVRALERFGERPALVTEAAGELSYAELLALTNRFATGLLAAGLEPGDRFAFLLPNGARIVAAYYACATTGIVGVPLGTRLLEDDLVHQLNDSGAVAVMYAPEFAEKAAGAAARAPGVRLWIGGPGGPGETTIEDFLAAADGSDPGIAVGPDDPYCVMYTGGTTGVSKAAIQTQESWAYCIRDTVEQLGIVADDRHAVVLPMTHAAWFTAAGHLEAGARTHLLVRWDPERLLALTEAERLTKLHMLPTLLGDLLTVAERDRPDVGTVGLVSLAGSPIPVEMYRRAQAIFGDVICNIYGLTEASGPVTYLLPADMSEERLRSGGRPGTGVEVRVEEDPDAPPENAGIGEILLRGPQMTPGYLNRPEETAAAYDGEWFRTGDIGYRDEDGFLYIVDRKKEMVKTGGFNVYPKEVEEALYAHPDVIEAAAFGVPDAKWMEALQACVVLRAGASVDAEGLRAFAREGIAGYKVPKEIHIVDALPRTNFGKFDKKALQRKYAAEPPATELREDHSHPATPKEKTA